MNVVLTPSFKLVSIEHLYFSLYNFYGSTMTIKGSLHGASPIVKRFSAEKKLSPVNSGPKIGGFSGIRGNKC